MCNSDEARVPRLTSFEVNGKRRRYSWKIRQEVTPFKPSCASGDLLLEGMDQHAELGNFYRSYLVDQTGFLPDVFDSELVSMRASGSERCVKSAIAFMNGMFPPAFPDEILDVKTGISGFDKLNPDPYGCSDLRRDYAAYITSDEFKARAESAKVMQKPLYDHLNLSWDGQNWQWIGDWLLSFYCSGQSIPSVVTEEMLEAAIGDTEFYSVGFVAKYKEDATGPLWRLLMRSIDDRMSGFSQKRFELFSAHDATITAILAWFDPVSASGIPPYRSHIAVEMYELDGLPKLRFVYNGDVLTRDGKDLMDMKDMKRMVLPSLGGCADMH